MSVIIDIRVIYFVYVSVFTVSLCIKDFKMLLFQSEFWSVYVSKQRVCKNMERAWT